MIRFALDSPAKGPGYVLIATVDVDGRMPAVCSKPLPDSRTIADAAAALIESLPEHAEAFEKLHDAIDVLPNHGG